MKDAVVVFDEAHNLAEAVHGAHGASVTGAQLDAVFGMVEAYTERFYSRLSAGNLRHLKTLKRCARRSKRARRFRGEVRRSLDGKNLNDFLFDAGADAVNVFALTKYLKESKIAHKIAGSANTRGAPRRRFFARGQPVWEKRERVRDAVGLGRRRTRRRRPGRRHRRQSERRRREETPRVGSVHAMAAFVSALAAAARRPRARREKRSDEKRRIVGSRRPRRSFEVRPAGRRRAF